MATWSYRGLTTKRVYRFNAPQAAPETLVTLNGEPCVLVNNDSSIRRGVASGPPPGNTDPYSAYAQASAWEQN